MSTLPECNMTSPKLSLSRSSEIIPEGDNIVLEANVEPSREKNASMDQLLQKNCDNKSIESHFIAKVSGPVAYGNSKDLCAIAVNYASIVIE